MYDKESSIIERWQAHGDVSLAPHASPLSPPCEGSLKTHVGLVTAATTCSYGITWQMGFFLLKVDAVVTENVRFFCFPNVHF